VWSYERKRTASPEPPLVKQLKCDNPVAEIHNFFGTQEAGSHQAGSTHQQLQELGGQINERIRQLNETFTIFMTLLKQI
jgi:hypothetical protein